MAYQSFFLRHILNATQDVPHQLWGEDAAINVAHRGGRYAVQAGTYNGDAFVEGVAPEPIETLPVGMSPQQIALEELSFLGRPAIRAFVNGVPCKQ